MYANPSIMFYSFYSSEWNGVMGCNSSSLTDKPKKDWTVYMKCGIPGYKNLRQTNEYEFKYIF